MANTENLLKLAAFLRAMKLNQKKRERFSLREWHLSSRGCGTSACAIGWAVHRGLFEGELSLAPVGRVTWQPESPGLRQPVRVNRAEGDMSFRYGWNAIESFFELEALTARRLFSPQYYPKDARPADVAQRIEEFCNGQS